MAEGRTPSGFAFSISKDALDDWELLEDLTRIDSGDANALIPACRRLLGAEGYEALKEYCRRGGRVKATLMQAELKAIFESDALKKLMPSQA